jgi:hypothetical protein
MNDVVDLMGYPAHPLLLIARVRCLYFLIFLGGGFSYDFTKIRK